jgi:hypothetical protein
MLALKPVLISEGIYRSYCTPEEVERGVRICRDQELRLNLLFTISAVAANVSSDMSELTLGKCNYNRNSP